MSGVSLGILGCEVLLKSLDLVRGPRRIARAEDGAFQIGRGCVFGNAAPAVAADEGGLDAKLAGLCDHHAVVLIIVGAEDNIRILRLDVRQLALEILVALGVALVGDDGDAQLLACGDEGVLQADGVVVTRLEDCGSCLGLQDLAGVFGHLLALEGIDIAGAEDVGVYGFLFGGCRSRQQPSPRP